MWHQILQDRPLTIRNQFQQLATHERNIQQQFAKKTKNLPHIDLFLDRMELLQNPLLVADTQYHRKWSHIVSYVFEQYFEHLVANNECEEIHCVLSTLYRWQASFSLMNKPRVWLPMFELNLSHTLSKEWDLFHCYYHNPKINSIYMFITSLNFMSMNSTRLKNFNVIFNKLIKGTQIRLIRHKTWAMEIMECRILLHYCNYVIQKNQNIKGAMKIFGWVLKRMTKITFNDIPTQWEIFNLIMYGIAFKEFDLKRLPSHYTFKWPELKGNHYKKKYWRLLNCKALAINKMDVTDRKDKEKVFSVMKWDENDCIAYGLTHNSFDISANGMASLMNVLDWYKGCQYHATLCRFGGLNQTLCRDDKKRKKCGRCAIVWYCNKQCQANDWELHKNECKSQPLCPAIVVYPCAKKKKKKKCNLIN